MISDRWIPDPLLSELQKDNSAKFHFIEGEVDSAPGPGIEHVFEGPYYSFYTWPRTFHPDDDRSVIDAYNLIYETIEEDGPFDGVLGFSHGATLAFGFLAHHARKFTYDPPPFRCAIFLNSLPPFRIDQDENFVFDDEMQGLIKIPTVHVVGKRDFVYSHSLKLHQLCDSRSATLLAHDKGHEIPNDPENVHMIAKALRELNQTIMVV